MSSYMETFAMRYAVAWCSQEPHRVAEFFGAEGSLQVNEGEPAVGTEAIEEVARGFMTAFPDMVVTFDRLDAVGERFHFHWTLIGTNSGPEGTGNAVRISGYEDWKIGADGLVEESKGHFDEQEYERQLGGSNEAVEQ